MRLSTLATAAAIGLTSTAWAQTPPAVQTTPNPPGSTAPAAGANSFTESQAKDRIEKAGFTSVSNLKKNDDGIWVGTATKGGANVEVMLDYKGNVTSK